MTTATSTATATTEKKVIPSISRPSLQEFGLGSHPDILWRDGVYICQHGKKQLYFSCELPLCENFDRIDVNSLYLTVAGLVTVRAMYLDECIAQHYHFIVLNGDGNEEKLMTWEFQSAFF
ncbi:hypothetical protein [Microcoleus sp. B4-C1]|uniref:hypothetical protein n=1 Tax=Microcoleus sp. B4-C1 TaxID=2818660 RepID=UPI002FD370F5